MPSVKLRSIMARSSKAVASIWQIAPPVTNSAKRTLGAGNPVWVTASTPISHAVANGRPYKKRTSVAPGIETQTLYDEEFQVVVPAKHSWAKRKSIAIGELDPVSLLLLPVGHCFRNQILDACGEFASAPAPGRQGNSLETLRSMVASGLGMTVLPVTALTPRHAQSLVKAVPFDEPRPIRRVAIAWRSGFPRLAALRAVADAARGLKLPIKAAVG